MGRVSLVLGANVFVIGQLGLLRELLEVLGWTIAVVQGTGDVGQCAVAALIAARMKKPVIVWRPELVGGNVPPQTV